MEILFVYPVVICQQGEMGQCSVSDRTGITKGPFCLQISLPLALALSYTTKAVNVNIIKRVMS